METLKGLDKKIAAAVEKVRLLKDEKSALEKRVTELEELLNEKSTEIERIKNERISVKGQLEELLLEIESIKA